MKHFSFIILSCIVLASCSEKLDLDLDKQERLLQMNSLLDSADTLHTVRLYWSTGSSVDTVRKKDSPMVAMYVNGVKTSESSVGDEPGTVYVKGRFGAGDVITLRATAGTSSAEAEVVAPSAASITQVDTSAFDRKMYFNVKVKDIPEESNYYWLSIRKEWRLYVAEIYRPYLNIKLGDSWGEGAKEVQVFGDEDPILSSKLDLSADESDGIRPWDMNIFSDESFRDGERTFRLKTKDEYYPQLYGWYSSDFLIIGDMYVKVRLHTLTEEAYRYFDSYQFEGSASSFLMVYPTIYPSNVKGGIGFVTAATSTEYVMKFPSSYFLARE